MKWRKKQHGLTMLEVLLAIAIATSVVILGVKFYLSLKESADERRVLANVDQLFQAALHYYQANCRRQYTADMNNSPVAVSPGSLDPVNSPPTTVQLTIQTDLINPGFLVNFQPNNPLVVSGPPDTGYIVQFTRSVPDGVMNIAYCPDSIGAGHGGTPTTACNAAKNDATLDPTVPPPQGHPNTKHAYVSVWRIQVKVKLLDATKLLAYKNTMSADSAAGGYLIWDKSTSFVSPDTTSDLWLSEPYVKAFNMQYTNDNFAAYSGVNSSASYYNQLYYLCGG